ncbi:MAG: PP2C family protein-serine/threonine phosphatase [Gemmatimonadota bacterium]
MSEEAQSWPAEQVVPLLQRVDLFEGLPEDDLHRIAAIVKGVSVGEGEVLFEEGDLGDAFYIVFDGAMEILKRRPDGSDEKLAVRRAGEAFGEMALLNDAPRSATARARQASQLMMVSREDFQQLLGGDSLALRMMRILSKALRALGIRFASTEKLRDRGSSSRLDALGVSRIMQAGLLPDTAPRLDGYDVAAGTTVEETGRGGSVWDWLDLGDDRIAIYSLDVRQDGFPPAYHLGVTRAVARAVAEPGISLKELLERTNNAVAEAAVEELDQFVEMGLLVVGPDTMEWASAGRVPAGIIRRDGTFQELGAHGPPLGMMPGFRYQVEEGSLQAGDTAFVLSHAAPGLFMGAADLVAQLHGKPAGEIVSTLHRAIRKAQGEERTETSVLFVRKH